MRWSGGAWRERVLLFSILLYRQLLHINLCIWLFFEHFEHFESNIDRASGSARLELEIFDRAITSARLEFSNKKSPFDSIRRQGNVIFLGGLWDLCPVKPESQDGPINPPFSQMSQEKPTSPSASQSPSAITNAGIIWVTLNSSGGIFPGSYHWP